MKTKSLLLVPLLALAQPILASTFPLSVETQGDYVSLTPGDSHTQVAFEIKGADSRLVKARVLDYADRRVSTLHPVGDTLVWDGRDEAGRPVSPGTYIVEVVEEPYSWSSAVAVVE